MGTRIARAVTALVVAVTLAACEDGPTPPTTSTPDAELQSAKKSDPVRANGPDLQLVGSSIGEVNDALSESGRQLRLARLEWVSAASRTRGSVAEVENHVVFADDRRLRLGSRWVPGDPRREGRNTLAHMVDGTFAWANSFGPVGSSAVYGEPAIDASFETWNGVTCSGLDAAKVVDDGSQFPSLVLGGDVTDLDVGTVGFLPGFIFDLILADPDDPDDMPSEYVLGVTFTFVWGSVVGGEFVPSDIDGNGLLDTAFKEVWYNDAFLWSIGPGGIDIETVALHENGHVFELGHFGKIHATFNQGKGNTKPGKLHVSPRAVMNAVILGILQEPLGTDDAAFCGNFGAWPNN